MKHFTVEEATWAVNSAKVASTITQLQKQNADLIRLGKDPVDITEEIVKVAYLKRGGAIVGDTSTFRGITPQTVLMVENAPSYKENLAAELAKESKEDEEDKTVRKGKNKE